MLALLYLVLIQVTINRKLKRLGAERVRLESVIFRYLIDISNGMLSIRSMGLEDRMASLLAAETRGLRKNLTFSETIKRIPTNVLEVIVLAMLLLLSIFYSLDKKEILAALPTLMLFTLSGVKLNSLVSSFAANVSSIWALLPSVEQLAYELRQGTSIAELETLHSSNKEEKISLINTISATQLGFSYDGERSILKNCDFELSSPSCLAIYGPSGSGKSTLGLILTNFMRPTSGRILVNGKNMNSVAKKSLNQKLGYVSPNDYFFEDSIINN